MEYQLYNDPCDHLCAILLFCNFQHLRISFAATYRVSSMDETDQSVISRHSNFANLGKYVFEIVHLFGNRDDRNDTYYHCINNSSSIAMTTTLCVKAPLSVTKSRQIILNATFPLYDKNGLILEIQQNKYNNYCGSRITPIFDCKYYSDFIAENEILMIGNDDYYTLKFVYIINLKSFYDYKNWILIYDIIKSLVRDYNIDTSEFDKKIKQNVIKLLGNEMNKKLNTNNIINGDDNHKENNLAPNIAVNPYLDLDLMKGFADFTPDRNRSYEQRYNKKEHNTIQSTDYFDNSDDDKFDSFELNELPKYIDCMFDVFCNQCEGIKISWPYLNDENGLLFLNILLTHTTKFHMIRLERFTKLFQNCQEIYIFGGDILELNKKVMEYIYQWISINQITTSLNKLIISNVYHKSGLLTIYSLNQAFKKYKEKFSEINCELSNENTKQFNETLTFKW